MTKQEQICEFLKEIDTLSGQGGLTYNEFKVVMFLTLDNSDNSFTQAESVKKNSEKKWVSASVSRAIKNLLALNIVEQIVINTTLKYKINLDWKYGYTYREEIKGE